MRVRGFTQDDGHIFCTEEQILPECVHFTSLLQQVYRVPVGAEPCCPTLSPDQKSLFLSIQHPAQKSPAHAPSTRWPDFSPKLPPRPAVVVLG
jgi:secreted PhoX family phosphatase